MDNTLKHYGILGMKWGVRRSPKELARARGGSPKKKTSSSKAKVKTKKESISDLSDEELRRRVQRLQMEKQYRELTPKTVSFGRRVTDTVLNKVIVPAATEAGKQLVKDFLIDQGKNFIPTSKDNKNNSNKDNKDNKSNKDDKDNKES